MTVLASILKDEQWNFMYAVQISAVSLGELA